MGYDPNIKAENKVLIKGMVYVYRKRSFCMDICTQHSDVAIYTWYTRNEYGSKHLEFSNLYLTGILCFRTFGFNRLEVKKSWTLFAIHAEYNLLSLLVVKIILSYWVE